MKRSMFSVFTCILLLGSIIYAQSEADEIRAVEHERLRAIVDADTVTTELLHADNFQLITPLGGTLSKSDYLGMIASGDVDYLFWEPGSMDVLVYGDAAVIRYQAEIKIKVTWAPNAPEGKFWHTDLYEKQDGQWKVVWSQATQIK
jgi:hypothetical protein